MEELKIKQKDLIGVIGSKSIVSEVLNKRQKLTVNMIRKLSEKLQIAAGVLIQEYDLQRMSQLEIQFAYNRVIPI